MDLVTTLISAIQLAIAAAPKIVAVYEESKIYISALFKAGVIDKAMADALHAHVDAIQEAHEKGEEPPAWQVEPDPS